jgi:hypothetical protein
MKMFGNRKNLVLHVIQTVVQLAFQAELVIQRHAVQTGTVSQMGAIRVHHIRENNNNRKQRNHEQSLQVNDKRRVYTRFPNHISNFFFYQCTCSTNLKISRVSEITEPG